MPARSMNAVPGPGVDAHAAVVHQRQARGDLRGGRHAAVLVVVELPDVGERAEGDVERAVGPLADLPGRLEHAPGVLVHRHRGLAGRGVQPLDVAAVAPDAEQRLEPLELGEHAGETRRGPRLRRWSRPSGAATSPWPAAARPPAAARRRRRGRTAAATARPRAANSPRAGGGRIVSGHMLVAGPTPCPALTMRMAVRLPRLSRCRLALSSSAPPAAGQAGVTRLEIVRREVVLNGQAFGAAGAYEKLVGRVALRARSRGCRRTTASSTSALAPTQRAGAGRVLGRLLPAEAGGPGARQRPAVLRSRQPRQQADPAGVPERRRLRRSDDRRGVRQRRADAAGLHAAVDGMAVGRAGRPHADGHPDRHRGRPADHRAGPRQLHPRRQRHRGRHRRSQPRGLPGRRSRQPPSTCCYVRTLPTDPPQVVPRARWRFASPGTITLDGGFEAGRIYDVVYRARDPRVVGVGLAGTRDLVSFFKHATAAEGNPMPGLRLAIGWGVSQTGRFLRHFVYQGFNEDERGRIVFDGVFDQVGGAGRGSFNHRFGQQSRDQLQHFNIQYPVDMFPFTDETRDRSGDRPHRRPARARAAIEHRAEDGAPAHQLRVLQPRRLAGPHRRRPARATSRRPTTSRIYMVASAPHIVGAFPPGAVRRQGLRRPGADEPARLRAGPPRRVPRPRRLGRRRHGAAGEPLPAARRRHAGRGRRGRLAGDARRARCRRRR